MSQVKRNVIANLAANVWIALVAIAFIPLYIHFMGLEAYGLVGFYMTLQALFAILDMGLTTTLSRELARLSILENSRQTMRELVRTLEVAYWIIALSILLVLVASASWIAGSWLNTSKLSGETVRISLMLMALAIALRMPYGFYAGGLLGLQRQVLLNGVKVAVETTKSVGVILILWLVEPTVYAFFSWQAIVNAIAVPVLARLLWSSIPGNRCRVRFAVLAEVWRFAVGMSAISILSTILVQSEKLVLSKMLSLESFAHYALASMLSTGLFVMISPLFSAIYPRLTQLVASEDKSALTVLYHKGCQLMTVFVLPVALIVSFFAEDLLRIWTQDPEISKHAAPILSLLIIGSAMNGLMIIPNALQLAYGWTGLLIKMHSTAIGILIPALILVVPAYGPVGAAGIWLAINLGYLVFGIPIMHKRLLTKEMSNWLLHDLGIPAGTCLLAAVAWHWGMPESSSTVLRIVWILSAYLFSFVVAILVARDVRPIARTWINQFLRSIR